MLSLAGRVCRSSSHLLAQSNMPSHHARDLLELSCADTHCHRDKDHRHTLFALTTSTLDICIVHSFAPGAITVIHRRSWHSLVGPCLRPGLFAIPGEVRRQVDCDGTLPYPNLLLAYGGHGFHHPDPSTCPLTALL